MAAKKATKAKAKRQRLQLLQSALFRWLVFGQLLVLFLIAYVKMGGLLISQTNHTDKNMFGGDQMHNMRLATQTREDLNPDFTQGFTPALKNFFPHRTDGVVQPIWPWVSAWLVAPDHQITEEVMISKQGRPEDYQLFNRGRWFNVFVTATFLVFLGIAACRKFSLPAACNLLLLGGFGALLPRAAYFQPEPLYFIFFFLTWVACISALKNNSLWIYGVIGVISGLAYMTKSSVQPLLAGFVVASSLRCGWEIFSARSHDLQMAGTHRWHWRNHVVGLVMLGVAHFMTIGPRLTTSYEQFGDMFHSYPSYWMWMDDFEEKGFQWMVDHPNAESLAAIPDDQKPSAGNYLKTHSLEQIRQRLLGGTKAKVTEFLFPAKTDLSKRIEKQKPWRGIYEARGWYLAVLAGILLVILLILPWTAPKAQHAGHLIFKPGISSIVFFVVGSLVGYTFLYGWYHPIGRGDRFMMSLYLPLVFTLIWGADAIVKRIQQRQGSRWILHAYQTAHWLFFAALCWRLYEVFRTPFFYNR
jgi:hypothetical protein